MLIDNEQQTLVQSTNDSQLISSNIKRQLRRGEISFDSNEFPFALHSWPTNIEKKPTFFFFLFSKKESTDKNQTPLSLEASSRV